MRFLCLVLLAMGLAISAPLRRVGSAPQRCDPARPLPCTKEALPAFKPIPTLNYECKERGDNSLKSPERQAALESYRQELESSFAGAGWWAAPVDELNVCSITHEAREMTGEESRDLEFRINLFGDQSTRLVVVVDPCIRYSYQTLNAYLLARVGGQVYATQVLDAYFSRADGSVDMRLAQHHGERLIFVETHTLDGLLPPSPYATCAVYTIDPRSHRAVPKELFKEGGKLTNEFRWDEYVLTDDELAAQWHAPEIVRNGRLLPRFYVYTPKKDRVVRDTYVWNGQYYTRR